MGDIFGDIFGGTFYSPNHMTQIALKSYKEAKDAHEKKIHLFWNAKGRLEVWKIGFFMFWNKKM